MNLQETRGMKRNASDAGLTDEEESSDASAVNVLAQAQALRSSGAAAAPSPLLQTRDEGMPTSTPKRAKRQGGNTSHSRALEWFYDLISSDNGCVSWQGKQGHFVINDAEKLLKEFQAMRGKPNYKLNTILHNFFRPYNFYEIHGEKKIKNGNVYISLDIESSPTSGVELSVFRPGNRDKLANVTHRGTGLPQKRYFVNGTTVTAPATQVDPPPPSEQPVVPRDSLPPAPLQLPFSASAPISMPPPDTTNSVASTLSTMKSESAIYNLPIPRTIQAINDIKLTREQLAELDSLLLQTFLSWRRKNSDSYPRKSLKMAMGNDDEPCTKDTEISGPPSFLSIKSDPIVDNASASSSTTTTISSRSHASALSTVRPIAAVTAKDTACNSTQPLTEPAQQHSAPPPVLDSSQFFVYYPNMSSSGFNTQLDQSIGPVDSTTQISMPLPHSTNEPPTSGLGLSSSNILFDLGGSVSNLPPYESKEI